MNPCLYSVATLNGFGLRDIDIIKGFASMIKRKALNSKKDDDAQFPFTPEQLLKNIDKGPLPDLYNAIYLTLQDTYTINSYGYAITKSKNLATKIWSLAYDWETLINGDKNAKQILLGMTIHRTSGSKTISNILHKSNHAISYNEIRMQNQAWERTVTSRVELIAQVILKEVNFVNVYYLETFMQYFYTS